MQIDWFTWIAQIVNFLILIALLRHFLYGRIVNAIDEREEKIASKWKQADKEKENAEQEAETYREKSDQLEREKDDILSQARQDAEEEKKKLTHNAREEIKQLEAKWREGIEQEKQAFFRELQSKLCGQVSAITRRLLADMADAELEEQIVQSFVRRVEDSDEKKNELKEFVTQYGDDLKIVSSFEIQSKDREKLTRMFEQMGGKKPDVRFEQSDDLVCGLSLQTNGRKMDWSVASYMNEMQNQFSAFFEKTSKNRDEDE